MSGIGSNFNYQPVGQQIDAKLGALPGGIKILPGARDPRRFIVNNYFIVFYLLAVFLSKRQTFFAWDGIIIQREHLVGGEVEVPGKMVIEWLAHPEVKYLDTSGFLFYCR